MFCFSQCQCIYLPNPESDYHNSNVSPTIFFRLYYLIARCIVHYRRPFNEKRQCKFYDAYISYKVNAKLYQIKDIFIMETLPVDFYQQLYKPSIQKIALHLPQIHRIETNYCSNLHQDDFKHCAAYHDILCFQYYEERVVSSFAHQIQK